MLPATRGSCQRALRTKPWQKTHGFLALELESEALKVQAAPGRFFGPGARISEALKVQAAPGFLAFPENPINLN